MREVTNEELKQIAFDILSDVAKFCDNEGIVACLNEVCELLASYGKLTCRVYGLVVIVCHFRISFL